MKYVADTNTFLAVALNEPEKEWLISQTKGCELAAPDVLPYEVGNALSAMLRRKALLPEQVTAIWDAIGIVPVELVAIDIRASLLLAARLGIYAYDAYFLQCALELRCPLITLDEGMRRNARLLNVRLVDRS